MINMVKILKIGERIDAIKVGPNSTVDANHNIVNPEANPVVDITLDDKTTVQVKWPPTMAKIRAAINAKPAPRTVNGISEGQTVP